MPISKCFKKTQVGFFLPFFIPNLVFSVSATFSWNSRSYNVRLLRNNSQRKRPDNKLLPLLLLPATFCSICTVIVLPAILAAVLERRRRRERIQWIPSSSSSSSSSSSAAAAAVRRRSVGLRGGRGGRRRSDRGAPSWSEELGERDGGSCCCRFACGEGLFGGGIH